MALLIRGPSLFEQFPTPTGFAQHRPRGVGLGLVSEGHIAVGILGVKEQPDPYMLLQNHFYAHSR